MTYGFKNSVLVQNGIDPETLHELPEELRNEILDGIPDDDQESWESEEMQEISDA